MLALDFGTCTTLAARLDLVGQPGWPRRPASSEPSMPWPAFRAFTFAQLSADEDVRAPAPGPG
jgi:hypothetical protein